MNKQNLKVAVLGASPKEERYSNQAVKLLLSHNYEVFPINPAGLDVCELSSYRSVKDISDSIDVLTMYVNSARSTAMQDDILNLAPQRIIFNPGSENEALAEACMANGIEVEEACTLVLLNTGQF